MRHWRKLFVTTSLFLGSLGLHAQKKGIASFYHNKFEGRKTSTGEIFDQDKFTAASNNLELGTYVKVTNEDNGRTVYVRINDRMNASNKRLIDLASVAAKHLSFTNAGLAKVKVEVVPEKEGKMGILAQNEMRGGTKNRL
jgi:rare lipoprotein A